MRRLFSFFLLSVFLLPSTDVMTEDPFLFPTEILEISTFRNTSVGGTLMSFDMEDTSIYFNITADPVKGELVLCDNGTFIYTPGEGKQGRDSFQLRALNSDGTLSRAITVSVQIEKQKNGVWYEDMRGRPEAYAAALLSERGLFTGEKLVDRYCFCPEKAVTRGEFLSICMYLSGKPLLSAVCCTGYKDDTAIPVWMKSYVATASFQGIEMTGFDSFDADAPLSKREAAQLARQILDLQGLEQWESDDLFLRADMASLLEQCL